MKRIFLLALFVACLTSVATTFAAPDQGQSSGTSQSQESAADQGQKPDSDQARKAAPGQDQKSDSDQGQKTTSNQGQKPASGQSQESASNQNQKPAPGQGQESSSNQNQKPASGQSRKSASSQGQKPPSTQSQKAASAHSQTVAPDTDAQPLANVPVSGVQISPQIPDIKNPYAGDKSTIVEGETLFHAMNCVGCHAPEGGGGMGPALSDNVWIYGGDPGNIYLTIEHGRPAGMPAWGGALPPQAIWSLVAYVRTLSQKATAYEQPSKLNGK